MWLKRVLLNVGCQTPEWTTNELVKHSCYLIILWPLVGHKKLVENAVNLLLPAKLRRRWMNVSTNSLVDFEIELFDDDMLRDERSSL